MTPQDDVGLQKDVIFSFLNANAQGAFGNKIFIYDSIDSTNVEAKRLIKSGVIANGGAVILADHQSAGRGRLGRNFFSPQKSGIYLTAVYDAIKYDDTIALTVAAAVAVGRSLESFGVNPKIKWVNDLYVKNKKVCGILTEGIFSSINDTEVNKIETYIIGIGINVFESKEGFPEELKGIAGSINKHINRNELVAVLLNNLCDVLGENPQKIVDEYRKYSFVIGKTVTVVHPNKTYSAKVLEITDLAHLIVELDDGSREELLSGEISLRL